MNRISADEARSLMETGSPWSGNVQMGVDPEKDWFEYRQLSDGRIVGLVAHYRWDFRGYIFENAADLRGNYSRRSPLIAEF